MLPDTPQDMLAENITDLRLGFMTIRWHNGTKIATFGFETSNWYEYKPIAFQMERITK